LFVIKEHLKHNPITVKHPFPQLTRKYPILRTIDQYLGLTAGLNWYMVKEKSTGKNYYVGFDARPRSTFGITIVDIETRILKEVVSEEDYRERYDDQNKTGYRDEPFTLIIKG
jgi:hypothetical protein